ncbi:MAG: NYN domain-containing protein, partial [Candidatus Brocadiaceae bacterium]|nr:NYN domain-containing protein [Candidatus Brocadiaceae bacterium]
FVDGWNFKKNLQEFRYPSTRQDVRFPEFWLDEKHFDWAKFFKGVINKFNIETQRTHLLVRAYWYTAESITPFIKLPKKIQEIQTQYQELNANDAKIEELAREWHDGQRRFFNKAKEEIYEGIQRETNFLEFKYVGQYKLDPYKVHKFCKNSDGSYLYQGTRVGERGVDVGIATDMIAKLLCYDAAILVSGDIDFLPVVHYIKDKLRQVYQFSIARGVPPNVKYLSPWLMGSVDAFQYFNEVELLQEYLKRGAIPREILQQIDGQIRNLKPAT